MQTGRTIKLTLQCTLSGLLLLVGSCIYILFRTTSLRVFEWIGKAHLSDEVGVLRYKLQDIVIDDWILFCLPDACWSASYITLTDAIWKHAAAKSKVYFASIIPLIGVASELLQFFRVVPGYFDIIDIIAYILPLIIYIIIISHENNN